MTAFKDKMIQDMKLRSFSSRTQVCYLRHIEHFEKFFDSDADFLNSDHIREFLAHAIDVRNQRGFYSLLFKAASETLQELALDKKYLGAQIGITSFLHTWGQTLSFHPHLHCIIPTGGLSSINQWIKLYHYYLFSSRNFKNKN